MASKQVTLMESWKGGSSSNSRGRGGRGRGQGQQNRRGRSRGRGNSRGRGRGKNTSFNKFNSSISDISYVEDEDDELCLQALGQFELNTSDLSRAFEVANNATELPGFDETAGQIWIYPTNKPVRDYQFQIVQTALFNNTLVSLPTGLGKTFIAAVLMYNFHRWYPEDLIVFMAPTRPLVRQQLEACHNIVGIHPSKTIELTGHIAPKKRDDLWKTKSVFFLTPQVMTSDLARGVCPLEKVRCVVVDEAHKALGQHAYAQVIAMLSKTNTLFRVLALSATPGSDLAAVQQVFKNLLISRVELRSESCSDILPYIHNRKVDKVVVPLDEHLTSIHKQLVEVYQVYSGKLMKQQVLHGRDGSSFTVFQLLKARESFRSTMAQKMPNYLKGYIEVDFATCISLAHATDLLVGHGLRSFFIFLQGVLNGEKASAAVTAELKKNTCVQEILSSVQQKLNISTANSTFNLNSSSLFSSFSKTANLSYTMLDDENTTDYMLSHPKMKKLKDIVIAHFKSFETKNETTRVMIFSQYRDSVQEIGNMLQTLGNLVKPMVFIGQANVGTGGGGRGLKQKDQVQVIQRFREGGFNVLVSTCVGEEGLDIGEVDLIVCFDASKSPTRLVQRMGRTGRQRTGQIIFLLTKGREERNFSASFSLQNSISKNITDPAKLRPFLYKFSPRMVPAGVDPQCFKMNVLLTSEQETEPEDVILIDDDSNSNDNFGKSTKSTTTKKKNPKPTTSKAKGKKAGSRPGTAGNATSSETHSEKTLTQCFEDIFQKASNGAKKLVKEAEPSTSVPPQRKSIEIEEVNVCGGFNNEDYFMADMVDHRKVELLCDIFDVIDVSKVAPNPCLYIPKPPKPLVWLPEYNELDKETILLKDFDLDCLKEKLEALKLESVYRGTCICGNVNPNVDVMSNETQNQCEIHGEDAENQVTDCDPFFAFDDFDDDDFLAINSDEMNENFNKIKDVPSTSTSVPVIPVVENSDFNMDDDDDDFPLSPDITSQRTKRKEPLEQQETISVNPNPGLDECFIFDENDPFFDIDDSSTTSNDGEFQSPKSRDEQPEKSRVEVQTLKLESCSTKSQQSKIESPKPMFEINIDDLDDDSSTTSNDEDFHSQVWVEKLPKEQNKSNNNNKVIKPFVETNQCKTEIPKESEHKVNRELFKDDFLLFEDDDEEEENNANSDEILGIYMPISANPAEEPKNLFDTLEKSYTNNNDDLSSSKFRSRSHSGFSSGSLSPEILTQSQKRLKESSSSQVKPKPKLKVIQPEFKLPLYKSNDSSNLVEPTPPPVQDEPKRIFKFRHKNITPTPSVPEPVSILLSSSASDEDNATSKLSLPLLKSKPSGSSQSQNYKQSNSLSQSKAISKPSGSSQVKQLLSQASSQSKFTLAVNPMPISSQKNVQPKPIPKPQSVIEEIDLLDLDDFDFQRPAPKSKLSAFAVPQVTPPKKKFVFKKTTPPPATKTSTATTSSFSKLQNSKLISSGWIDPKRPQQPPPKPQNSSIFKRTLLDDDFSPVKSIRSGSSFRQTNVIPSPDSVWSSSSSRREFNQTSTQHSVLSSSPISRSAKRKSKKRRRLNANPFLDLEADASDEDSNSEVDEADEFDGLDEYDESFVHDQSEMVSDSQQVRYMQSVKDIIPKPLGRIERPLAPLEEVSSMAFDVDSAEYDSDSFCIKNDDEVEFADIGVFTQAMNVAREEVMKENPDSAKKVRTRRQVRAKQAVNLSVPFNPNVSNVVGSKKRRRRIIYVDSSDED